MPSPSPISRRSYTFILVSLLLFRLVFQIIGSIFIFSSLRRWDECALIFQNSGWCTEEPKADWHVLLAIIFERSAFLRQWLLCARLLFPPHPPKKLPKTGYQEQENEVNCFNSPPHLYGVTFPMHPSINSQPSRVGVVVRVWVVGVCV